MIKYCYSGTLNNYNKYRTYLKFEKIKSFIDLNLKLKYWNTVTNYDILFTLGTIHILEYSMKYYQFFAIYLLWTYYYYTCFVFILIQCFRNTDWYTVYLCMYVHRFNTFIYFLNLWFINWCLPIHYTNPRRI